MKMTATLTFTDKQRSAQMQELFFSKKTGATGNEMFTKQKTGNSVVIAW